MLWNAVLDWFARTRLARQVLDASSRNRARRRLADLDHELPDRCQARVLHRLVRRAAATRFGRDHDFHRIRTPEDFRRLVPLRHASDLWRDYWEPAFPHLAGITWPGPISHLAVRQNPEAPPQHVPISGDLLAVHRAAAWSAFALAGAATRNVHPLASRFLLLEAAPGLFGAGWLANGIGGARAMTCSLEALFLRQLPGVLRPRRVLIPEGPPDPPTLQSLLTASRNMPLSCLAGLARMLVPVFQQLLQQAQASCLTDIWPQLSAIVYLREPGDPDRSQLAEMVRNSRVALLEAWVRPEGTIAVEDARHGLLRLLPDHGVYFEFVPLAELGQPQPARHGIAEVKPGVPYAVAVSSPAGYWACLLERTVCFEHCHPPLLRLLDTPVLEKRESPPPPAPAPETNVKTPAQRHNPIPAAWAADPFSFPASQVRR